MTPCNEQRCPNEWIRKGSQDKACTEMGMIKDGRSPIRLAEARVPSE